MKDISFHLEKFFFPKNKYCWLKMYATANLFQSKQLDVNNEKEELNYGKLHMNNK